jgi:hypothetical protein
VLLVSPVSSLCCLYCTDDYSIAGVPPPMMRGQPTSFAPPPGMRPPGFPGAPPPGFPPGGFQVHSSTRLSESTRHSRIIAGWPSARDDAPAARFPYGRTAPRVSWIRFFTMVLSPAWLTLQHSTDMAAHRVSNEVGSWACLP